MPTTTRIRGLTRLWTLRSEAPAAGLAGSLTDRVLASRGLADAEAATEFLSPTLNGLHDPSRIPHLDRAAERILAALRGGEPVVIFGDYDVDGITATCILWRMMRAIVPEASIESYIPHRLDEGYGLNEEAVGTLANRGAKVIVSVDCGITAVEPARVAKELGVDLIITDHHNPPASHADLPDAFAVVHPRHPDSDYPFGELCGAGVAYKLAWRLATLASENSVEESTADGKVRPDLRVLLIELLGPCTLGVIADLVPLVDENRVIAKFGLPRIHGSSFIGLQALQEASGLGGNKVSEEDLGFRLAPRLNAIGRLGHAADAVELMMTDDPVRARQIAGWLSKLNDERRAVERKIVTQACEMAEAAGMTGPDRRAIVLAHEDWHPGVVGIVCSRLVEKYARPTILMQNQGERCAGSGRSLEGFNLHGAMGDCSHLLTTFGGHNMAAGLKLDTANLDAFTQAFIERVGTELGSDDLVRPLRYDGDATLDELTPASIKDLRRLAPFGMGNASVRVRVRGLRVQGRPEPFGKAGTHLSLRLRDAAAGPSGPEIRAIAWGWAQHLDSIPPGSVIDAVLTPQINSWGGRDRVEPVIEDVRLNNPEPA
ncbi:MAG: single-stranded-DNA-specific exonuclease [Phycisphaerales bacterium]|jgi:single-stranded-DNA-specific exonuclease